MMRHGWRIFVAIGLCFLASSISKNVGAQPAAMPPEMLADAALHDVFFINEDRGWAVGDRGVIWATDDAGRHWRLADSPVNCSLRSIHFVDEQNGWIVGGWSHPYSSRTSSVILRTENGGRRWKLIPSPTMPQLTQVKFFDQHRGWAVGTPSAMYPAGVFRTEDGGRSWSSFAVDHQTEWLAGDFNNLNHGVLVGRGGNVAAVNPTAIQRLAKPNTGLRHLRAVRSLNTMHAVIAGDGGLLLVTDDGGRSWHAPELPLPPQSVTNIDFRSIEIVGDSIWVIGNPGTFVLRSHDQGHSWQVVHTNQALPIHAMRFVDQQRGWAVGALGTILATNDGGENWVPQHSGGKRAALLGLFAEVDDVPLEIISRYCGDEGYLGVVESLTRRDVEVTTPANQGSARRLSAAVLASGGTYANTTWRLPLRQSGLAMNTDSMAQGWSIANNQDGMHVLEECLVARLRQWRPDVVLTGSANVRGQDSLTQLVSQAVVRAVAQAADPTAFADQIQMLGLEPWQVKKVCSATNGEGFGAMTLDTSQLATRLGRSIRQHATYSYSLIHDRWSSIPRRRGIQLLTSAVPPAVASRDLFSGVVLAYGSEARRVEGHPIVTSLSELRLITQKERAVELLLTRAKTDAEDFASWSAQIDELTRELSPLMGGNVLYRLAQHYREIGRYELACESLQTLIRKYPSHALSEAAMVWCLEYLGSEEASLAFGIQPAVASHLVEQASHADGFNAMLPPGVSRKLEVSRFDSRAQRAGFDAPVEAETPLDRLLHQAENLQRSRPALFADPKVRFAVAAAFRKQGLVTAANRLYQQVAGSQPFDAWRQTAHAELWLTSRKGHSPKPLMPCPLVADKPYLDGRLDEPLWQGAANAELKSQLGDDQQWPASVKLARDGDYLYVGVRCRKIDGLEYKATSEERAYDRDLSSQDRVEVMLDTNRDYASFVKLSFDHRGWTGDSAWGDIRWNPEWFVASDTDEATWTIETAIPLRELSADPIPDGTVWACGLQRIVPGVGFQSWTQPASVAGSPEGFGFVSFE